MRDPFRYSNGYNINDYSMLGVIIIKVVQGTLKALDGGKTVVHLLLLC